MILHLMMSNGYAFHSVVPEGVDTPEEAAVNTSEAIEAGIAVQVANTGHDDLPQFINAGQIVSFYVEV